MTKLVVLAAWRTSGSNKIPVVPAYTAYSDLTGRTPASISNRLTDYDVMEFDIAAGNVGSWTTSTSLYVLSTDGDNAGYTNAASFLIDNGYIERIASIMDDVTEQGSFITSARFEVLQNLNMDNFTNPTSLERIKLTFSDIWGANDVNSLVDQTTMQNQVNSWGPRACMQIETWPIDDDNWSTTMSWYQQTFEWVKDINPNIDLGVYRIFPQRNYWASVSGTNVGSWQKLNDDAVSRITPWIDTVYPSIYTFYSDRDGWVTYCNCQFVEARKFDKPIYPFVWPRYHETNNEGLAGELIPGDYWKLQLECIYENGADGIVLWAAPGNNWDKSEHWWEETLDFINRHVI